jgi:Ni,Fe-hydrogenase III large subunit
MAWCAVEEALAGVETPPRAQALRAFALELERLANHTGDLGALAGDVGYLPAASYFGGLRGDFLNLSAGLCGNRFGRGFLVQGGVRFDPPQAEVDALRGALRPLGEAFERYAHLLFDAASVQTRFEGTGTLDQADAEALGLVGVAARSSGCDRDARRDHPQGYYRFAQVTPQLLRTGDVYARAMVRRLEAERSLQFLEEHLAAMPSGATRRDVPAARLHHLVAVCVEGWRGEIVHAAVTDGDGKLAALQIVDPSLRNWTGLAAAMRGQAISDFPLCNKSFNLSYAGHDR